MTPEIRASGRSFLRPRQNVGGRAAHGIGIGEIEHDAADVGFVDDVARHDLEHDGRALREQRLGIGHRLVDVSSRKGRDHRNLVGLEQVLDLDRIEPLAAVVDRSRDNFPRGSGIGRKFARASRAGPGPASPPPRGGAPGA